MAVKRDTYVSTPQTRNIIESFTSEPGELYPDLWGMIGTIGLILAIIITVLPFII